MPSRSIAVVLTPDVGGEEHLLDLLDDLRVDLLLADEEGLQPPEEALLLAHLREAPPQALDVSAPRGRPLLAAVGAGAAGFSAFGASSAFSFAGGAAPRAWARTARRAPPRRLLRPWARASRPWARASRAWARASRPWVSPAWASEEAARRASPSPAASSARAAPRCGRPASGLRARKYHATTTPMSSARPMTM